MVHLVAMHVSYMLHVRVLYNVQLGIYGPRVATHTVVITRAFVVIIRA